MATPAHERAEGEDRRGGDGAPAREPSPARPGGAPSGLVPVRRQPGHQVVRAVAALSAGAPPADPIDGERQRVEALSGVSLDDVSVVQRSSAPGRIGARAYTEGTRIHLGPGQDRHLGHELWHVVQQKQGRVEPTGKIRGRDVNLDPRLEAEADAMARRPPPQAIARPPASAAAASAASRPVIQGFFDLYSTTFKDLISEQEMDQTSIGSTPPPDVTTIGFEHEFAQMDKGGPLSGVSHLE